MSLLTNECKVCGDVLLKGHAYQSFDDYVCILCYEWANRIIHELTKTTICDTLQE